jgi:hypothetical protein
MNQRNTHPLKNRRGGTGSTSQALMRTSTTWWQRRESAGRATRRPQADRIGVAGRQQATTRCSSERATKKEQRARV